jgi:hypothetical protein
MSDQTATETSPAYFPFKALTNMLDRMQGEGVPAVVDKSYVANLPWGYQNHFLATLRNYGLTRAASRPRR